MTDTDQATMDALYERAVSTVLKSGRASVSYLQRELTLGYNKAYDLIERMEKSGLVSAPNHAGKREVLQQSEDGDEPTLPGTGHNSHAPDRAPELAGALGQPGRERLRQTVAKIERLEEEKKEVAEAIKEVYAEAKALGFDTKALRAVIRLRKIDKADREEQELMLDTYLLALGEI